MINYIKAFYIGFLTILFLTTGCIEQIDFNTERESGRLLVDGKITDSNGDYTLKLYRTSVTVPIPLGGASITIYDDLGNQERYEETEDGIYELKGNQVQGSKGRTYFIDIELPDGTLYRSEPETMPLNIGSDSVYSQFAVIDEIASNGVTIEKEVIKVFSATSLPDNQPPVFLKWKVEEVFKFTGYDFPDPFRHPPPKCYVTSYPNPQNILLFNGKELQTEMIKEQMVVNREIDFSFHQRHYINVILSSITEEAYQYWEKIDQIINSTGTIFDVPPASVRGNIFNVNDPDELVLGYFEAALTDTTRLFWTYADLPVLIQPPCHRLTRPECRNCLLFDNSSYEPPDWWLKE